MEKTIEITNPERIIYPKQKIKKIDVVKYYIDVSNYMLPFLTDRPLAVIRCHDGIKGECFFKKHPSGDIDVKTFKHNGKEYFYVKNCGQIVCQAQMGTVEFHTWACTVKRLKKPDTMIFDLDPDENLPLSKLREAVLKIKDILDELRLKSFLKTSGGKGYHITVPFGNGAGWDKFYGFARDVAFIAEQRYGDIFTTNIRKSERRGKIFVDYLRNNVGATCVAPYSLRARDGAPVSMPIAWKDLYAIKPNEITLKNYKDYLCDPWKDFFD